MNKIIKRIKSNYNSTEYVNKNHLEIKETNKGLGLFAKKKINKGSIITYYPPDYYVKLKF